MIHVPVHQRRPLWLSCIGRMHGNKLRRPRAARSSPLARCSSQGRLDSWYVRCGRPCAVFVRGPVGAIRCCLASCLLLRVRSNAAMFQRAERGLQPCPSMASWGVQRKLHEPITLGWGLGGLTQEKKRLFFLFSFLFFFVHGPCLHEQLLALRWHASHACSHGTDVCTRRRCPCSYGYTDADDDCHGSVAAAGFAASRAVVSFYFLRATETEGSGGRKENVCVGCDLWFSSVFTLCVLKNLIQNSAPRRPDWMSMELRICCSGFFEQTTALLWELNWSSAG